MAKSTPKSASASGSKRWIWIVGGVAATLFLAALIAPFFIPWDKLKDEATAFASQKLGRKLSIEKVEVSLFTGVRLVNVELANGKGFSKEPLFKNDLAKLDLSFFSLLTGKVVINAIEFRSPKILVEKGSDGKFNFSDIGASAAKAPETEAKADGGSAPSLPVVVAALVIKDGDIVYRDKAKGTEQSVKGLDFKLMGFSLKSGGDQRLEAKLTVETEGKSIPITLVSNFSLDLPAESLVIKSFELGVPSVKLSADGSVKNFKAPDVDVKAALSIALASVAKDLLPPSLLKSVPGGLDLGGSITFDVAAKGSVAKLDAMGLNGALSFEKVDAKYGDYPAVKNLVGKLSFDKSAADLPALTMDLAGSPVTFKFNAKYGTLENAKNLKMNVTYSLSSPLLVLDPLLPIILADDTPEEVAEKARVAKATGGIQDLSKKVPAGLNVSGSILIDAIQAKKIKTGKLTQKLSIAKQQLKSATNLDLYGGVFWERTEADLAKAGPTYKLQSGLSPMQLDGLLGDAAASMPEMEAVQKLNGKVFGLLSYKIDATGKGFKKPALMKNMKAEGAFSMKDGKILKTEWQEKIASAIPHPQTQEVIRQDLVFQNLRADFKVSSDRIDIKSLALGSGEDWRGGDIFLQASGFMVPGANIDFKVVPHFNPAKVQLSGALADAFSDDKGWVTYNYIAYYGPTMKAAKADFSKGVQNAAKKVVEKKVEKAKEEVKQKVQEEVQKQVQEKAGDLIKQLPGGLFGR